MNTDYSRVGMAIRVIVVLAAVSLIVLEAAMAVHHWLARGPVNLPIAIGKK